MNKNLQVMVIQFMCYKFYIQMNFLIAEMVKVFWVRLLFYSAMPCTVSNQPTYDHNQLSHEMCHALYCKQPWDSKLWSYSKWVKCAMPCTVSNQPTYDHDLLSHEMCHALYCKQPTNPLMIIYIFAGALSLLLTVWTFHGKCRMLQS